jgi:CBS-domain-containing membrane protein
MSKNPVALAADDTCAVAAAAFREYRLKSLPVVEHKESRKLSGCIRVRRLMAFVFKELRGQEGNGAPDKSTRARTPEPATKIQNQV